MVTSIVKHKTIPTLTVMLNKTYPNNPIMDFFGPGSCLVCCAYTPNSKSSLTCSSKICHFFGINHMALVFFMRMYLLRWLSLPHATTSDCARTCTSACVCTHVKKLLCPRWYKNNRFSFHPFIHVSMLTTSSLPNAMLAKGARGKKK